MRRRPQEGQVTPQPCRQISSLVCEKTTRPYERHQILFFSSYFLIFFCHFSIYPFSAKTREATTLVCQERSFVLLYDVDAAINPTSHLCVCVDRVCCMPRCISGFMGVLIWNRSLSCGLLLYSPIMKFGKQASETAPSQHR